MVGIYKIENPKGRIYIGQSKDIEVRWKDYRSLRCKGQRKLYYSLNKYGIDRHIFTVQEECTLDMLNERERYWQEYYRVLEGGLNLEINKTTGTKRILSLETRQRMSDAQKGKTQSESTKKKIQETRAQRGIGAHTEEAKRKISEALKKRVRTQETFEKIATKNRGQKRTEEARRRMSDSKLGTKNSEQVKLNKSQAAKTKKNAGNLHSCKSIGQYSIEGSLIKNWTSMSEAARELNVSVTSISTSVKTNKLGVGYFWKILTK